MFSIYKKLYQWFAILSILFVGFFCSYENDSNTETANPIEKKITPQKEYTFEIPCQWEAIRSEHIPEIRFDKTQKKDNLKVQLNGKNFSERHYIEALK